MNSLILGIETLNLGVESTPGPPVLGDGRQPLDMDDEEQAPDFSLPEADASADAWSCRSLDDPDLYPYTGRAVKGLSRASSPPGQDLPDEILICG